MYLLPLEGSYQIVLQLVQKAENSLRHVRLFSGPTWVIRCRFSKTKARQKELRAAFNSMGQDKEASIDAMRSGVELSATTAEYIGKVMALIAATPPHIADRLAETIKPR